MEIKKSSPYFMLLIRKGNRYFSKIYTISRPVHLFLFFPLRTTPLVFFLTLFPHTPFPLLSPFFTYFFLLLPPSTSFASPSPSFSSFSPSYSPSLSSSSTSASSSSSYSSSSSCFSSSSSPCSSSSSYLPLLCLLFLHFLFFVYPLTPI